MNDGNVLFAGKPQSLETFFISIGGEKRGPYTRGQIQNMWDHGTITADSSFWNEPAEEWRPIYEFFETTVLKDGPDVIFGHAVEKEPAAEIAPWSRLFARTMDDYFFGLPALAILQIMHAPTWWTLPAAMIFEIVCVGALGNSLGKWLMGLRLVNSDGNTPAPDVLMRRVWSVKWRVFLFFVTYPLAYSDLKRLGSTKWDRDYKTHVTYNAKNAGRGRAILFMLFLVGMLVALVIYFGRQQENEGSTVDRVQAAVSAPVVRSDSQLPDGWHWLVPNDPSDTRMALDAKPQPEAFVSRIIYDSVLSASNHGGLDVQNGSTFNAVVKLVRSGTSSKVLSFAISGKDKIMLTGIPDGQYEVYFSLGDELSRGTDNFTDPKGGWQFNSPLRVGYQNGYANSLYIGDVKTVTLVGFVKFNSL